MVEVAGMVEMAETVEMVEIKANASQTPEALMTMISCRWPTFYLLPYS